MTKAAIVFPLVLAILATAASAHATNVKVRAATDDPDGAGYTVQFCRGPLGDCGETAACANVVTPADGIKTIYCATPFRPRSYFITISPVGSSGCGPFDWGIHDGTVSCQGTSVRVGPGKF